MDIQIPFSLITFIILFFFLYTFITLHIILKTSKSNKKTSNKPIPGPWKLPLIGNTLNMISSVPPHRTFRDLAKKHGPIMHLQIGEISTVIISSPQLAEQVLKTHDHSFINRKESLVTKIMFYNCKDLAFARYGDYWRQMRKICTVELLSARKVKSFAPIREDEATNLILYIQSSLGTSIDIRMMIFKFTINTVCKATCGKTCRDGDAMMNIFRELSESVGGFHAFDIFPSLKILHAFSGMRTKLERLHKEFDNIMDSIIAERRGESVNGQKKDDDGDDDLLDILLRIQENQDLDVPITTNDVKAIIMDMFVAGADTSTTLVEWAMSEMMKTQRVMHKAQLELRKALKGKKTIHETDIENLGYLKLVIKETLRLHPPISLPFPRLCGTECEIGGYIIPVNTSVVVNVWAMGRDPKYWVDAEIFEPERFENMSCYDFAGDVSYEYIPFGAGRRRCPGISFGLADVMLPLASLLYHFDWKLAYGMKPEDLDMMEGFGLTTPRKNGLYLVPIAYDTQI